jgi:hypothetical protein
MLQIAARHVLKDKIMKYGPSQVPGRSVYETADYVVVTHTVQCTGLILKILEEGKF